MASLYRKSMALLILQLFIEPWAYGSAKDTLPPGRPKLNSQSGVQLSYIRDFCTKAVASGQITISVDACVKSVRGMMNEKVAYREDALDICLNRGDDAMNPLAQLPLAICLDIFKRLPGSLGKVADETGLRDWLDCNDRVKVGMDSNCNRYFGHRKSSPASLEKTRQLLLGMHKESKDSNEQRRIQDALLTVNQTIYSASLYRARPDSTFDGIY